MGIAMARMDIEKASPDVIVFARVRMHSMDPHAEHEQQGPWPRWTTRSAAVPPPQDARFRRVLWATPIHKWRALPGREPDGIDRLATISVSAHVTSLL